MPPTPPRAAREKALGPAFPALPSAVGPENHPTGLQAPERQLPWPRAQGDIHTCSESQGQAPAQLLPTGLQGLVPSPKAGTNCDSPAKWYVDVRPSGDGSQPPTTGCGRNAGILQMGPTAAWKSCSLLNQLHRTPIPPPRHLDAGQLCCRGHSLEERPLGRAGIPKRPARLGRRPVQASVLQASLAFPRIRPQNAPPWKIMEMLICLPSSGSNGPETGRPRTSPREQGEGAVGGAGAGVASRRKRGPGGPGAG